ncbi:hypothetical protein H072_2193 [Dactylellina haptotyla CBS 200.50]|uniref:SANT domain-containing protein n=1 Tax=Dactylellina haptotyla (strain CBS 200.50) TaxID=1284197 RepID=S8ALU9_DACHA|nr:hypothetical protein H072_2193 [Dactylellina haptotyla CBS 200.50]
MSSQQSPPPHPGPPANRNPPASSASRSISPHKRTRSPDFSREPPKGPRAYLSHQGGPPVSAPGSNVYGSRAPGGPRGRSPPPLGPRSRTTVGGPLSAGSGMSPVGESYNGFRDRPREYDDGYRNRPPLPRMRDPAPPGVLERRQSIGGPMGGPYPRRTTPPRRSRSPPERRGWTDRMDRYNREEFRDNRDDYFRANRDDRHYPRESHPRDSYPYSSQSYRPEPREGYTRDFHRPSISSQGAPVASPVDDPNKLAREQREREAAEYKKRRTAGARPSEAPERKRSTHTRSPSPSSREHQNATHSPPHTVSSRYTSNPSPSTNSPPPFSDRNPDKVASDAGFSKSDNQPPSITTPVTPHPPHTPSTYQRNLTRPTTSVPILSAPAPPSVPSFRDIPLGPRALSNSSLRTIPTGPKATPTGLRWDKDKKDGDKDDSGTLIKEEPHDKDRMMMDDKPPMDEPSPVEEGEVVNSGDERSVAGDHRDMEIEESKHFRKESSASETKSERAFGLPASSVTAENIDPRRDTQRESFVKDTPVKEPTEQKSVPQDKRHSTSSNGIPRDQPSMSVSPTSRYAPLPSPSTESTKPSTIPTQPANFVPTSPSSAAQNLPPSIPTGPRAQAGRGGFWSRPRGNMMAPAQFGRGVGSSAYPAKREEDERRPSWNSGRGNLAGGPSGRPGFVPSGPSAHFNRPGQPFTSPKLTNTELRRAPSVDNIGGSASEKGGDVNAGRSVSEEAGRPFEPQQQSQDVEMSDVPQESGKAAELNIKQESPVDTKGSGDPVKTEASNEDEDDALTTSDVTKRIEDIDKRIGFLESHLSELSSLKQTKRAELEEINQREAEMVAKIEEEERKSRAPETKPTAEDEVMADTITKQDSLSPTLAAEFAAQSMEDKPSVTTGPLDSSPEPEQPSTPKASVDIAPTVKEDEDMMVTDVKEEPGARTKESFDTTSLPYFCAGPQREPMEYEFWKVNVSQHTKVENLIAQHIMEQKTMVDRKILKLKQEYRDTFPSWKHDCEKLDTEEKRKKKSDSEPADAVPAEVIPPPATLEVSGTASLGRRSGRGVSSDFVTSEYEIERIMKLSEKEEAEKAEAEAKEKYDDSREAIVPDMILDPEEKARLQYVDTNCIITNKADVKSIFKFQRPADNWTDEEQKLFKERFAQFPKQWGKIALGIDGRDYKACILHYYQTKQASPYKDLVRPAKATRRRKNGRGVALTAARTTRARASALDEMARRNTPLEDEDVDSEDAPPTRPRRAAAPVFGDTGDNDNATPVPSGKRGAGAKPSIVVEDASTPTPAEKTTGKRQRGPKADKEKKEKSASRGRTPNATPASEKTEKATKNKGELLQTPQELSALGALANLSVAASSTLPGPAARTFGQDLIQPAPLLKQEPGTKMEEEIGRLQPQPFVAQPYLDPHTRMNLPTQPPPQAEIVPSRPLAPGRRPGPAGGRGRKAPLVDEDGVVIAPVTSSYWSVPETQDFPQLLACFGTNFEAIAEHLGTKTTTMVRNNYQRGCEQGKDYQRIAEEANRKITSGEPLPQAPPPIAPSSKRRYDTSNSQAGRSAVQVQPVDPDTEMIDSGARKAQRLPPHGAVFTPNRTVAVGPEARVPAQMPLQSKPGPKPGTFKDTRPAARQPAQPPFVQSASGIEDYRPVIPPRVPIEATGKTAAQPIQIADPEDASARQMFAAGAPASLQRTLDLEFEQRQRQVLQQRQEHLARQQEQAAQATKLAQQQQQPPAPPPAPHQRPSVQALHGQPHGSPMMVQEQPIPARFSDPRSSRDPREARDPRSQDLYRPQPSHIQDIVKQEPREKRLSGDNVAPMTGIERHPIPHRFTPEENRQMTPPQPARRRSPPLPTQVPPRTTSDPAVSKMGIGQSYQDDRTPPRMLMEPVQAPVSQPSHLIGLQQTPQPTHRRHEVHTTPPVMPPQGQQQHIRTPSRAGFAPAASQQPLASAPMPPSQQQPPAPAPAPVTVPVPAPAPAPPTKSAGFSLRSILNDEPSEPPRAPSTRPATETWFASSAASSPYTSREPPAPQRPPPEPVSHYNSPSLASAVPLAYGRHSPTPSEPLYHSQRAPSSLPIPQAPPSGSLFQKTYNHPPTQTRTPPPRSTSHPNYPPQQPPSHPQPTSGPPAVHAYHEHLPQHHTPLSRDPRDPRESQRDPRDPYASHYPSRQPQYSPPAYQGAYPPPSSQPPHRETIERIHPDRTMPQQHPHIQTQQTGGYPPPPPPPQFHPSRPGEHLQRPPSLMNSSGLYDVQYPRGPRQMDSNERGGQ